MLYKHPHLIFNRFLQYKIMILRVRVLTIGIIKFFKTIDFSGTTRN